MAVRAITADCGSKVDFDGAGGAHVVLPGGDGHGADLQLTAGDRRLRSCNHIHGIRRDRYNRRLGVLLRRRGTRRRRLYRLVAAARHHQERGHRQRADALPHRAEHKTA